VDSLLEGDGFELSVPPIMGRSESGGFFATSAANS
jgi:hypothetical protein